MVDWAIGLPLGIAVAVLFGIVFARAQVTYWIGRGVVGGARHTRWAAHLDRPRVARATELINRWGPPVITVSFLTIGFQTAANAAAGLSRMPFGRYLLAMIPGCLAWAVLYATVGLAAVSAAVAVAATSPWTLVVIVALIAVGVVVWLRRRRAGHDDPAPAEGADG